MVRRSSKTPIEAAWDAMAKPAYSANTHRAWQADGAVFQAFCEPAGFQFFHATPQTVRAFIKESQRLGKKPATIPSLRRDGHSRARRRGPGEPLRERGRAAGAHQ